MLFYKHMRINTYFQCVLQYKETIKNELYKYYSQTKTVEKKPKSIPRAMKEFFQSDHELTRILPHIPLKYLNQNTLAQHFYLISPVIAKDVASKILPFLDLSGKQLIAETNAGLGLITLELLKAGVNRVRMYESCSEFRIELKDFGKVYPDKVELFTKGLFQLKRYAAIDKHDRLNRVENLFVNTKKRSWTDEPFMSIVGPMDGLSFLRYLIRTVALQITPCNHGRIQTFAILKAKEYAILTATATDSNRVYTKLSILFSLLFDIELLGSYPRKVFIPWTAKNEIVNKSPYKKVDLELRYLVRVNFKKTLPLEAEKLMYFIFFLDQIYNYGNDRVIPKLEKWFPGSGVNIICTIFKAGDISTEINIFTQFKELFPEQVLQLFEIITQHPTYKDSAFMEMVETELMRYETIESSMAGEDLEHKLLEDIQEKLNYL